MGGQIKVLENGIRIKTCAMPNTHSVCIILYLKGGMAWEPLSQNGITHLVEHLCFRRANGMYQEQFYYEIERIGGYLRGVTYRDGLLFEITVHPKYFNEAMGIIRSLFEENGWTHEDIRREKEVVYRQIEDSGAWCYKRILYDFFNEMPQGEFLFGTKGKVKRLGRPQLIRWKKHLFNTQKATVVAAGEISDTKVEDACKLFSDIPQSDAGPLPDITPKGFLNRKSGDDRCYTEECETIKIGLTFDVDTGKIRPIEAYMLQNSLCRGLLAPFTMRLREELGLLHEIDCEVEFFPFGGLMYFIFDVYKDKALLLMDEIAKLFAQQKKHLDEKAFACTYVAMTDSKEVLYSAPREFAYLALEEDIITPKSYIERNRQVTYEEIQKSAQELFKPENLIVNMNDVPVERELMKALYEKRRIFRNKLGE